MSSSTTSWRRCLPPSDGSSDAGPTAAKPYFYNIQTGKTVWKLPKGFTKESDVPLFSCEDEASVKEDDLVAVDEVVKMVQAAASSSQPLPKADSLPIIRLLLSDSASVFAPGDGRPLLSPFWQSCVSAQRAILEGGATATKGCCLSEGLSYSLHPAFGRGRCFPGIADLDPANAWRQNAVCSVGARGSRSDSGSTGGFRLPSSSFDGDTGSSGGAVSISSPASLFSDLLENGGIFSLSAHDASEESKGYGGAAASADTDAETYYENVLTGETAWSSPAAGFVEPHRDCNAWIALALARNRSHGDDTQSAEGTLAKAGVWPFCKSALPLLPALDGVGLAGDKAEAVAAADATPLHLSLCKLFSLAKGFETLASGRHRSFDDGSGSCSSSIDAVSRVVVGLSSCIGTDEESAFSAASVEQRATALLSWLRSRALEPLSALLVPSVRDESSHEASLLPTQSLLAASESLVLLLLVSTSSNVGVDGTANDEHGAQMTAPVLKSVALAAIRGLGNELCGPLAWAEAVSRAMDQRKKQRVGKPIEAADALQARMSALLDSYGEAAVKAALSSSDVQRQRLDNSKRWIGLLSRCFSLFGQREEVAEAARSLTVTLSSVLLATLGHSQFVSSSPSHASLRLVLNALSLPCLDALACLHSCNAAVATTISTWLASGCVAATTSSESIEEPVGSVARVGEGASMAHVITGAFSSGLAALVTGGQGAGDGARAEPAGVIDDVATRRLAAVSLCTALLQSPSASALFFSSDVEVLVRVCLQQLEDLPPADTARLAFLRLLRQASLVLLRPSPSGAVSPNACVLGDIAVECLVALVEAGRSNAVSPGGAQASGTSLSRRLSASMSPSSSSAPAVSLAALPTPSKALAVLPPSPASPEPASVLQSSHQRFSLPSAVVREAQVTLEQIREALPLGKSL